LKDSSKNNSRYNKLLHNPLFLLILITLVITVYLVARQTHIGVPYYDVFVYLNNALIFTGIPVGNLSVIYLSPLMPFLTSLVFRAGYISSNVIFILNGIIFIFGVIGLYLLFNQRFNQIQSLTGCLIFMSFPLIFTWAASGGIDVPGVSFSIWAVYALVVGIKKDSKYLYLVFPLATLAFLTRYTSAVLIFPMVLYILINQNFLRNIKGIVLGVLAGLAILAPFFIYIYTKLGNLLPFINIFTSTLTTSATAVNDLGYKPEKLYFLKNILNYISLGPLQGSYRVVQNPSQGNPSILAYIIALITLMGLGLYVYQILKQKIQKIDKSNRNLQVLYVIILIFFGVTGIISFFTASYMITELIFLAAFYVGYLFLKEAEVKNLKIDFLFLSWFAAFFIFHSVIPLKVDRYFITMSPALAYFILLGLSEFIQRFKFKIKQERLKSWGIYLMVGLLLLSFTTAVHVGHTPKKGYVFYIQSACDWLKEYDPQYENKTIYSDYDPAVTWCLKKEVKFGVPRLYNSPEDFSNFLRGAKADYYIDTLTDPKWNITGYHIIKEVEGVAIYEKDP
jgi:4-amino-4-deoxy-L-arabinose transferase-like glycosyltransferase